MRTTSTILAGVAAALLPAALSTTPGLLAAPAHADGLVGLGDGATHVHCIHGATISGDNQTYELDGPCADVLVTASNAVVRMPTATELVVRGDHNTIHAKPVQQLRVRGHDQKLTVVSTKRAVVSSPGSRVTVKGLLEHALVRGDRTRLSADQISGLRLAGNRNTIAAGRGYDARVAGNHNHVSWRRLDHLVVPGDGNHLDVRRGSTEATVTGSGNEVDLNRAG